MAFSTTVKSPLKGAERISRNMGIFAGQITISSYATTVVECTAITRNFVAVDNTNATAALFPHGIVSMVCDPISESGFCWRWDATIGGFECYYPTSFAFSGSGTGAAVTWDSALGAVGLQALSKEGSMLLVGKEALANDAPGTVNFTAVGFIR